MADRSSHPTTVKDFLRQLVAEGWRVETTGKHVKAYSPNGVGILTIPRTPSDHRALKNAVALKRRIEKGA